MSSENPYESPRLGQAEPVVDGNMRSASVFFFSASALVVSGVLIALLPTVWLGKITGLLDLPD